MLTTPARNPLGQLREEHPGLVSESEIYSGVAGATKRAGRRLRSLALVSGVVLLSVAGALLVNPQEAVASSPCAVVGTPLGNGTSSNPVLIGTAAQLAQLSKDSESANLSGYYKLTANIDLGNCAWTPIGNRVVGGNASSTSFQGTLDGGGYRVSGLNVSSSDEAGLFGRLFNAVVKDLFLDSATVASTGRSAGAFAGVSGGSTRLERVRATGSVSGTSSVGGLIGLYTTGTQRIVDSYSLVNVTSSLSINETGGLVGYLTQSPVERSFSAGLVSVAADNTSVRTGGLIGFILNTPTITASFYDQETSGMSDTGKGLAQTTAQMKNIDTFTTAGWAISSGWVASNPTGTPAQIWGICSQVNGGYPFLLAEYSSDPCVTNSPPNVATTSAAPNQVSVALAATGVTGSLAAGIGSIATLMVLIGVAMIVARRRAEGVSS